MDTVRDVKWRNVGAWFDLGRLHPSIGIKTPWGNLIVKRWADRLFSERYGTQTPLRIGSLAISWVWLRKFVPISAALTPPPSGD